MQDKLQIKCPLFCVPTDKMNYICGKLNRLHTHQAIVIADQAQVEKAFDTSSRIIESLKTGNYQPVDIEGVTAVGVISLSDIVERVLDIKIHDKQDAEQARKFREQYSA